MEIQVYRRSDKKWAWRMVANNGQVVATDGGQGYDKRTDALEMATQVTNPALVEIVTEVAE